MNSFLDFITKKEVYGLLIILIAVFVLNKVFNSIVEKLANRGKSELEKKKRKTVVELIKNIKKYAILILGLIFILDLYGVNITSIVASLGIASALLALALQDSLKDIISGTSIILDNYYIVGDIIKYKDFTGTVIQLGLRATKIKDANGQVLTIANRNVDEIVNLSQKRALPLIVIPTAYEEKIEKVEKILNEVVEEIKTWDTVDEDKTEYLGILELADSCVNYGIRFCCDSTNQFKYKWAALRLVKQKYDENNIKIPYPQIEVHNAK